MEGNQVGNRLVPGANGINNASFGSTNTNSASLSVNNTINGSANIFNGANANTVNFDNAYLPPANNPNLNDATAGRLAAEKARKVKLQQAEQLAKLKNRSKIPRATAAALTWDTMPTESTENPNPISDEGLVWPRHLIEEIARARKPKNVQLRLTRALFFIGCLGALAASLVQLILIAVFQDIEWVRTTYAPTSGKIALGVFILLDIILIPRLLKTLQNLRETTNNPFTNVQPFSAKVRHRTLVYAFGLLILNFITWLGVILEIQPHLLTILLCAIIILTPFFSLCVQRNVLPSRLSYLPLQIFFIVGMTLSGLQIILNFVAFYEEPPEPIDYAAIERLAAAQAKARVEGVPSALSDLVFAICGNQTYSVIFLSTTNPNSGLFECSNHEVYSVAGPTETSETLITGQAFYFGTTYDALISRYFPASTGAKYLFRDFRPAETANTNNKTSNKSTTPDLPSELVLLLPAASDEELVTTNLNSIANLIREHGGSELRFSLFYSESLNTVLTTRDFILIAATDTITLNDWLPHGTAYQSIIDGQPGTYEFTLDQDLSALVNLGADPTLYSAETRDAIKSRRHISTIFSGIPTSDALRTQLLEAFIEP